MESSKDPLSLLIADDAAAVDKQQLADLLKPFVVIDRNSKEFSFRGPFTEISGNTGKLEIILSAAKARSLFFREPDGLSPSDIIALAVMPEGSVKTSLKRLNDTHKIKKSKDGRYFLPAYRIAELVKQFNN